MQRKKRVLTIPTLATSFRQGLAFLLLVLSHFISQAQITVVVESLPSGTSGSDTIFITGDFNDWAVNDPRYMLERQLDGKLSYQFPKTDSPIEYKFIRGSWMKVETNSENEYLPNRILPPSNEPRTIFMNIANWQDLGGARPIRIATFYYFAVAFLGLILLLFVHRTKKSEGIRRKAFTCINLFLVLVFTAALLLHLANIIWLTYVEMALQVFVLAWGPAVFLFLHAFDSDPFHKKNLWFFLPSCLMIVLALLEISNSQLVSFMNFRWTGLTIGSIGIASLALVYTATLLGLGGRNIIQRPHPVHKANQSFIRWYFRLNAIIWFLFAGYLLGFMLRIPFFITQKYDLVLIPFSSLIFLEMYYLWKFPEILSERNTPTTPIPQDLQEQLDKLMQESQVFKNPDLSIADLSELLNTKPHILSRLLNENYHKNFRDYLNSYRVDAFIKLADKGHLEKYTFLALAHEVGFNSKSTFNLAFKKHTNQSPRSYFKPKSKN